MERNEIQLEAIAHEFTKKLDADFKLNADHVFGEVERRICKEKERVGRCSYLHFHVVHLHSQWKTASYLHNYHSSVSHHRGSFGFLSNIYKVFDDDLTMLA